jgi:hypothetical protein
MADRVQKHGLGRVIPQRDATAVVNAIRDTVRNGSDGIDEVDAKKYLKQHSLANLDVAMLNLLRGAGLAPKS